MKKMINKWHKYLVSEITADQAKEKFGDILFGSGRYKDEEDTEEESEIFRRLKDWYYSNKPITEKDLYVLVDLYKSGLYLDFLEPPDTEVCRVAAHKFDLIKDRISQDNSTKISISGNGYQGDILVYKINPFMMGFGGDRKYASWAVERKGAADFMKSAIASNKSYEKDCVCFYFAYTADNKESFMINPDETKNFSFGYERETFQIDNVKVHSGICYKLVDNKWGTAPHTYQEKIYEHFQENYLNVKKWIPPWQR